MPLLPRSVGCLPTFFPPEGGFGHRPVHREPCPVNALQGVVVHQALFPQGHEDIRLHPLLEPAVGGTARTDARGLQGIPLAASAQHEEDGIHGLAVIDAGPMTPQGVRFPCRKQVDDALPQHVRDAPAVISAWTERVRWDGADRGRGLSP